MLIDATGEELEPISSANAKGMLLVEGPGAAKQVAQLGELLEAAPALRSKVAHAEWVGNRRWNLTFTTDQVLALPQGDRDAATALVQFARLDGQNRLLGRESCNLRHAGAGTHLHARAGACSRRFSAKE